MAYFNGKKVQLNANLSSGSGGQGWTAEQITLLEAVFANLKFVDGSTGQTAAAQLIASLRGSQPEDPDIEQDGSTLIIRGGYTATQDGSTLKLQ